MHIYARDRGKSRWRLAELQGLSFAMLVLVLAAASHVFPINCQWKRFRSRCQLQVILYLLSTWKMNRELALLLQGAGLSETTIAVLDNEAIHNVEVFQLLHEEHVQKLLGMLPLGQHALLTELWQRSLLEANESQSTIAIRICAAWSSAWCLAVHA